MGAKQIWTCLLVCSLAVLLQPFPGLAQQNSGTTKTEIQRHAAERDGQHDFDFEIGTWKTHLKRLLHPLTGSTTWVEYEGTTVVRKIWDGRANLVELEVDGPGSHIEGLSLRLYNPASHQWSLYYSNSLSGSLSIPAVGEFKNGRGEFYDQEDLNGRAIWVRFVISDITADSVHFEQAFSDDGGKAWEVNWITTDTRVKETAEASRGAAGPAAAQIALPASSSSRDRQSLHDAWWTGPMLAPNATTLPRGHFLVEPYLYDVIGPHSNGFGSLTYINYGLVDRFTVGVIPTFGYNKVSDGPSGSAPGMGDVTLQAQYGITKFHEGSRVPTTAFTVQETFPTGSYDRLGSHPSDALGAGAYTTTLAFYSQTYLWMPNGRILRARFNVVEAFPSEVGIKGVSVYDTGPEFSGHAHPGNSTLVDIAGEYSMTQRWVLALDVIYKHVGNTSATGVNVPDPTSVRLNLGTSDLVGFAPAFEYNWKPTVGVLLGTRVIALGHNTPVTITPAIALNIVH